VRCYGHHLDKEVLDTLVQITVVIEDGGAVEEACAPRDCADHVFRSFRK